MKRIGLVAGVVLLLSMLAWAGSVSYFSTWKNPNFSQLDVAGRKLAVFVISAEESMRLGPEETLVGMTT